MEENKNIDKNFTIQLQCCDTGSYNPWSSSRIHDIEITKEMIDLFFTLERNYNEHIQRKKQKRKELFESFQNQYKKYIKTTNVSEEEEEKEGEQREEEREGEEEPEKN